MMAVMVLSSRAKQAAHYSSTVAIGRDEWSYEVYLSRRRTTSIMVHRDGRIVVRAPLRSPRHLIHRLILEKAPWIERKRQYFQQNIPPRRVLHYVDGETHLYLGREYALVVHAGQRGRPYVEARQIHLPCPRAAEPEIVKKRLFDWYREQARREFVNSVDRCWERFAVMGCTRPTLRIRRMKTLWGSLARRRVMTLNLHLIRARAECIDYVVNHELCHLKHHNHTRAFYALMDQTMTDWRERKRELEKMHL